MEDLEKLKKDKQSFKSSLTKYLNKLAVELSLEALKKERIMERLQDIEKRRDELLELLDNLQALYKEKSKTTNAAYNLGLKCWKKNSPTPPLATEMCYKLLAFSQRNEDYAKKALIGCDDNLFRLFVAFSEN